MKGALHLRSGGTDSSDLALLLNMMQLDCNASYAPVCLTRGLKQHKRTHRQPATFPVQTASLKFQPVSNFFCCVNRTSGSIGTWSTRKKNPDICNRSVANKQTNKQHKIDLKAVKSTRRWLSLWNPDVIHIQFLISSLEIAAPSLWPWNVKKKEDEF